MYAIGVHLSHVDVSGNAHTAVVNTRWCAFAQTRSLLFGPTFVKCIPSLKVSIHIDTKFFRYFNDTSDVLAGVHVD